MGEVDQAQDAVDHGVAERHQGVAESANVRIDVTITEALRILQRAPEGAPRYHVGLACGFTPLHLETLLAAHLQQSFPQAAG